MTNRSRQSEKPRKAASPPSPKRLRLPLDSATDVRRELARLYRQWRAGERDIADVSRASNVLFIIGRMIDMSDFESKLQAIENATRRDA